MIRRVEEDEVCGLGRGFLLIDRAQGGGVLAQGFGFGFKAEGVYVFSSVACVYVNKQARFCAA